MFEKIKAYWKKKKQTQPTWRLVPRKEEGCYNLEKFSNSVGLWLTETTNVNEETALIYIENLEKDVLYLTPKGE